MEANNIWTGDFYNNNFFFNKVDLTEDKENQNFLTDSPSIGLPKINNFPFRKVPFIIKRNRDILSEINSYFESTKEFDISEIHVPLIKGCSGEGKTTIATEFIFSQGFNFIACIYVDAYFEIESQIEKFAELHLGVQINFESDKNKIKEFKINAVKHYIQTHRVIVIFDNVARLESIREFIPNTGKCRIIVLSTNLNTYPQSEVRTFELNEINDSEAFELLSQNIEDRELDLAELKKIFEEVGYSPIALEEFNFHLRKNKNISINEFLEIIKRESLTLESLTNYGSFSTRAIHNASTLFTMLELKVKDLGDNQIDTLVKKLLSVISSLVKSKSAFKYDLILFDVLELNPEKDKLLINRVVERLGEISFCTLHEELFIFKELHRKFVLEFFSDSLFDIKVASKFYNNMERVKEIELMLGSIQFQFKYTYYLKNLALNIDVDTCSSETLDSLYAIIDDVIDSYNFYSSWIEVSKHYDASIDSSLNDLHILIDRQLHILTKLDLLKSLEWLKTIYKRAKAYHFCGELETALKEYETLLKYLNTNLDIEILLDAMVETLRLNFNLGNKENALKLVKLFQQNLEKVMQDKRIENNTYDKFKLRVKIIEWTNSSPDPELIVFTLSDEIIDLAEEYRENYWKSSPNYTLSRFLKRGELKRYPIDIAMHMNLKIYYKPVSIGDLLDITLISENN